jgi:hypothetical protein
VISTQTTDSLCTNDKQVWHTIRKELEDIGITVAAFDANKDFISEWFLNTMRSGASEERSWGNSPTEPLENSSDEVLNNLIYRWLIWLSMVWILYYSYEKRLSAKNSSAGGDISPGLASPSKSAIGTIPPQQVAGSRPHIPRVAALIDLVSRPNNSLISAVADEKPFESV